MSELIEFLELKESGNIRHMKILSVVLALMASLVANAQFGGSMMDMTYGPFTMLQRQDIRKELKLSKEQSKQMDEIGKNLTKSSQSGGFQITDLKKIDDDMLAVLVEKQGQRFFELRIQAMGGTCLSNSIVAEKLLLTVDQKESIRKIRKGPQDHLLGELRKGSRDMKLMENISKAEEKELLAALTDVQRVALTKLSGVIYKDARMKGMWPI